MLKDIRIIVGSAFLAFGLAGGSVYGVRDHIPQGSSVDGNDINVDDITNEMLQEAEASFDLEELMFFVNRGANLGGRGEKRRTLLHYYLTSDALDYVLAQGVIDLNAQDDDGNTPLHQAEDLITVQALIQAGADHLKRNNAGLTPREHFELKRFNTTVTENYDDYTVCIDYLCSVENAFLRNI